IPTTPSCGLFFDGALDIQRRFIEASRASHATGASRRSGERESVYGVRGAKPFGRDPMKPQTISEKILSSHAGRAVYAGDIAICDVDVVVGTDGSGPMAIDYFEQMGGSRLYDPSRVFFSLDHYAPPTTPQTRAFHDRLRAFADRHGATVFAVGDGISHQI